MLATLESQDGVLERRSHERLDGVFNVRFLCLTREIGEIMSGAAAELGLISESQQAIGGVRRGLTTNVSEGGFCLLTDQAFAEGAQLLVDVSLPGLARPVRAMAEVVRRLPAPSNANLGRYGVRFTAIHPDGLSRLREMVQSGESAA